MKSINSLSHYVDTGLVLVPRLGNKQKQNRKEELKSNRRTEICLQVKANQFSACLYHVLIIILANTDCAGGERGSQVPSYGDLNETALIGL